MNNFWGDGASSGANNTNNGTFTITVQETTIAVTNRVYAAYRPDLASGYVYVVPGLNRVMQMPRMTC